ncbi:hypothetical protein [Methanobrevibacter arboriphilus]|nr:hypothetical protein [Methanobrevibacter arboriphilus]
MEKKIFILKEIKEEYIKINGEIDDDFLKDYDEKYKDYSNDFQNFKKHFFTNIYQPNNKENDTIRNIVNSFLG